MWLNILIYTWGSMEEQITKNQHYVPKFYLRNFLNANETLWVYCKLTEKYFQRSPNSICYEKWLYETRWEKADPKLGKYILQNQLEKKFIPFEGTWNTLVRKIIDICGNPLNKNSLICNKDEKKTLASLVVNLFLRNPRSLNQVELNMVVDDLMSSNEEIQSIDQLLSDMNFGDTKSLIKAAQKKVLLDEEFSGGAPEQMINDLLGLSLSFLVSKDQEFITSDFPVLCKLFETAAGEIYPQKIYLPISPYCMLQYSNDPMARFYTNRVVPISNEDVNKLNRSYMKSQSKLLIAREESILKYIVDQN